MKVCIVSMRLPSYYGATGNPFFGGAEVQAAFVADALRVAGKEVVLVVADLPAGAELPFPAENAYHSGEGVRGVRFFHPRWRGTMAALERADADVYFQHCAGMITGLVSIFCRRRQRLFVYGGGSDRDFLPRRVPISKRRDRMLFRYGLEHCAGIVVQNEKQLAAARQLNKPMKLIPTGVRSVQTDGARPRDVIVWIGSLWSHKRPDRLIELARRVPECEFVMLGGDFPSELGYSEKIRREAHDVSNLTLMGRRPHEEVSRTLERATLLVNTSDMEGFPNAYLEAWSHGVPVVTFLDVDDIIRTSGAGVVVASMDEMAASIRSMSDESRRHQMSQAARQLASERFSPERLGAEYVDFFSSLR